MKPRHVLALALVVAACMILLGLFSAAWPATGTLYPPTIPTTYGPPAPTGGPQ